MTSQKGAEVKILSSSFTIHSATQHIVCSLPAHRAVTVRVPRQRQVVNRILSPPSKASLLTWDTHRYEILAAQTKALGLIHGVRASAVIQDGIQGSGDSLVSGMFAEKA